MWMSLIDVFSIMRFLQGFPDTIAFANRRPIFGGSTGGDEQINVDLHADSFESLLSGQDKRVSMLYGRPYRAPMSGHCPAWSRLNPNYA